MAMRRLVIGVLPAVILVAAASRAVAQADAQAAYRQAATAYQAGSFSEARDAAKRAAETDPKSPIFGMPVLDVEKAKTVLFVKRSMASGYAGVENELFFRDNTLMLFGDAKKMTDSIVKAMAH